MADTNGPEPEYVEARRVLLDALEALGMHRRSVVLIGAQAIYLRAGEGDLAVAPYTTDGDLVIVATEMPVAGHGRASDRDRAAAVDGDLLSV